MTGIVVYVSVWSDVTTSIRMRCKELDIVTRYSEFLRVASDFQCVLNSPNRHYLVRLTFDHEHS